MRRFSELVVRFGRDERGVFAVIFGLMAVVLVALSGAVVDYVGIEQSRSRGQIALDAATLALQPKIFDKSASKEKIEQAALALLGNRLGAASGVKINSLSAEIDTTLGSLALEARITMPTSFVSLVGVPQLSARLFSEAVRGSLDVEVAVVVDVTGSMLESVPNGKGGYQTKISALKTALTQLIDIVVNTEQTPSYSKMAIVPYSAAVNVGSAYAPTIRGPIKTATAITNIDWAVPNSSRSINNVSAAAKGPMTLTTSQSHTLAVNDTIYVTGTGFPEADRKIFTVSAVPANNKFQVVGMTSATAINQDISGNITECQVSTCDLVVASANHGLKNDEQVYVQGTSLNNYSNNEKYNWIDNNSSEFESRFLTWQIKNAATNTFSLPGTPPNNGRDYGALPGSGGSVSCVLAGCQYYLYTNREGNLRRQGISTCVTERTASAFTDAPPSVAFLGRNYVSSNNPCLSTVIQPLTHDKTLLHNLASNLTATGSTAGHIGIAWGWYMVSPNFKGPWPAASQPAVGDTKNVIKAVVIMTDGAFNTSYCNGVIASNSGSGSGNEGNKINCISPNGEAFAQAKALCSAMHADAAKVRVYTVAFDVGGIAKAQEIMTHCASEPGFAFDATSGSDLSAVFAAIGENLSSLRITR